MRAPETGALCSHGTFQVIEGHHLSLIRKRSQVRVLDRPSAGIQEIAAFAQFSGIWLCVDRRGLGAPRGHMGPSALPAGGKALWVSRRTRVGADPEARSRHVPSKGREGSQGSDPGSGERSGGEIERLGC
jgi:hypothetical protein